MLNHLCEAKCKIKWQAATHPRGKPGKFEEFESDQGQVSKNGKS